jgi:hypothetical protein
MPKKVHFLLDAFAAERRVQRKISMVPVLITENKIDEENLIVFERSR